MKDFIKKHKIILIIILVVMILAFGGAIAFITLSKKPIVITSNHEKTKEETKEEIKSELDMTVEEQYDSDIIYALSHYSLMFISDYNMLVGYPNAYKDSMICFYAEVVKVIEEGDDMLLQFPGDDVLIQFLNQNIEFILVDLDDTVNRAINAFCEHFLYSHAVSPPQITLNAR